MLEDEDSRETRSSAKLLQLVEMDSCFNTGRYSGLVFSFEDSELVSLMRLGANVFDAGSDVIKNSSWLVSMSLGSFFFTYFVLLFLSCMNLMKLNIRLERQSIPKKTICTNFSY